MRERGKQERLKERETSSKRGIYRTLTKYKNSAQITTIRSGFHRFDPELDA